MNDDLGFFAEPVDFIGVSFKPGHPFQGEVLTTALSDTNGLEALESDLVLLKKMPINIPLRVVGSTDSKECFGDACSELSFRRAETVHDWLLSRGIPASRLHLPHGYGSERPIGDNETEEGRVRNRRAYLSYEEEL